MHTHAAHVIDYGHGIQAHPLIFIYHALYRHTVIHSSFVLLATQQEVNSAKLTTFIDTINGKEKTWYVSFSAEVRPRMGARGMVAVAQVQSMYNVEEIL